MIRVMTDQLEQAVRRRKESLALRTRLEAATQHADATTERLQEARDALAREDRDVARQQSVSWSRVLSALRGSSATDKERETAERDAARYLAADAEARDDLAWRDVQAAQSQLDALGDVEAAYVAALAEHERSVAAHDPAMGAELARLDRRRGTLLAEDAEAREAHAAGMVAREQLLRARNLLGSARSWSSWDTFGGGGLFTDLMKYDKLDEVAAVLRDADEALSRFSRELADLRLAAVEAVDIDGLTRTFDVWFDNIFSDLAVRDRIRDAEQRVSEALGAVETTLNGLTERGHALAAELDELAAGREQVLLGRTGP